MLDNIATYYTSLPLWELGAVLLSVVYVVLAAHNNRWCWPAAFFSTAIFAVIFFDVKLLMDSALQIYYLFMAVYGWWQWRQGNEYDDTNIQLSIKDKTKPISKKSLKFHGFFAVVLTAVSLAWGWFMANYTDAAFPYLDTFTTVFAVFATYLVAERILENWVYWIVIDFVSIYLYISKGLMPTAALFCFFVVIAFYGYLIWKKQYNQQQDAIVSDNQYA